jgi:hypothetical protein
LKRRERRLLRTDDQQPTQHKQQDGAALHPARARAPPVREGRTAAIT